MPKTDKVCEYLHDKMDAAGIDPLYDDREDRGGVKFSRMDLIGLPYQIIVGPRGLKEGGVEIKVRATGERLNLPVEEALEFVLKAFQD